MTDSRASFAKISGESLHGPAETGRGVGLLIPSMGYKNPGPTDNLRGVEKNTQRGVSDGAPKIANITGGECAPYTDAPPVEGFKVYEGV